MIAIPLPAHGRGGADAVSGGRDQGRVIRPPSSAIVALLGCGRRHASWLVVSPRVCQHRGVARVYFPLDWVLPDGSALSTILRNQPDPPAFVKPTSWQAKRLLSRLMQFPPALAGKPLADKLASERDGARHHQDYTARRRCRPWAKRHAGVGRGSS